MNGGNGHGVLKGKVLKDFFISVFTVKTSFQVCQAFESRGKVCSKEELPPLMINQDREYLNKLVINKSMGPDRMHP